MCGVVLFMIMIVKPLILILKKQKYFSVLVSTAGQYHKLYLLPTDKLIVGVGFQDNLKLDFMLCLSVGRP